MGAKIEEAAVSSHAPTTAPMPLADASVVPVQEFSVEMGRDDVNAWMARHGFEMLTATFNHFTGTDMLRLTRQDLTSMCGLPHGTRLYYALRSKPAIRLTMYINLAGRAWYNALYLTVASATELASKLAALVNMNLAAVQNMYVLGPNGIHIQISDQLLSNVPNETSFSLQVLKDDASDRCCLLLRATAPAPQ